VPALLTAIFFSRTTRTTTHIYSTGVPGKIHLSLETAQLLRKAGKKDWVTERQEKIVAKGKGQIQTHWLTINDPSDGEGRRSMSIGNCTTSSPGQHRAFDKNAKLNQEKTARLVKWVTEGLCRILKQIHGQRQASGTASTSSKRRFVASTTTSRAPDHVLSATARPDGTAAGTTILEEVQEIIHMPSYNGQQMIDPDDVELDDKVTEQLELYVATIASMCKLCCVRMHHCRCHRLTLSLVLSHTQTLLLAFNRPRQSIPQF
jgi:hypothetical protein